MGGPRVTEEAKSVIIRIWLDAKNQGRETSAFQVMQAAQVEVRKKKELKHIRIPKLRTTQMILAEAYDNLQKLSQAERYLDEPWSLAALADFEMPAEAVPAVLKVWKLSLIGEDAVSVDKEGNLIVQARPITNREVKWVIRLHGLIRNTLDLMRWSLAYAQRERVSQAMGKPCESSDLDAALAMVPWEWATTYSVGKTNPHLALDAPHRPHLDTLEFHDSSIQDMAERAEELFWAKPQMDGSMDIDSALPDLTAQELSDEAAWVYALWLWHLRRGPKWIGLSLEERVMIVKHLRDWVRNHPWSKNTDTLPMVAVMYPKAMAEEAVLKPAELLKAVGYED